MEAIRDAEERYEPGAELVFRCVDIGKQDYSIVLMFPTQKTV